MKKLKVIDYLRGFSIFTIVLMHLLMDYPLPSIVQKAIAVGGQAFTSLYYVAALAFICPI